MRGQEEDQRSVAVPIDRGSDRPDSRPDGLRLGGQSVPSAAAPSTAAASAPAESAPAAAASASAAAAASPGTKFKGVSVNILTFNGPQVAEPLQRRAPDWEQLTGGHVNVVAVGFQTIYDKALLDASTGTNSSTRTCSTRSGWATSSARATCST